MMYNKSLYIILLVIVGLTFYSCTDLGNPISSPESEEMEVNTHDFHAEAATNSNYQSSGVYWFNDGSEVEGASATLLRTRDKIQMKTKTMNLDPHGSYTVWWVVFNYPEECGGACGEPDLFNDDVGGSVLYAAGHVIGKNGKGNFAGSLREGDLSGCQPPWDAFDLSIIGSEGEMDLCREGLIEAEGAEVHLVIRTHREIVPGMVNKQINTYAGACTAESSFGAGNGPNDCEDQQFAIFLSP